MKKTLLAAALFAGFAGAAQADTTVTLYGVLDTGIEYLHASSKTGSYSSVGLEGGGVEAGSRLGVKGQEDLGGGNQAFFNAVMGFNINDGSSGQGGRTFGRNALVGLQNNSWGMFQVGRSNSLANDMMAGNNFSGGSFGRNPGYADPFGTGYGEMGLGNIATSLDTNRYDNLVGYMTPVFGGFQFGADYSFNTGDSSAVSNTASANSGLNASTVTPMGTRTRAFDLAGTYNNGPIFLGLTYSQVNTPSATLSDPTTAKNTTTTLKAASSNGSIRQLVFAGSYDFTVVRVYGAYVRGWNGLAGSTAAWTPGGNTPNSITNSTTFTSLSGSYLSGMKQNAFMLGASAPVTANLKLFGEYQHQTLGGGTYAAGNGSAQNGISAGGIYSLSKRTNLYAVAGYIDGAQNVSGQKETVVYAGINHSF